MLAAGLRSGRTAWFVSWISCFVREVVVDYRFSCRMRSLYVQCGDCDRSNGAVEPAEAVHGFLYRRPCGDV